MRRIVPRRLLLPGLLVLAGAQAGFASDAPAALEVSVTGIKSDKGVIRLAICPPQSGFPNCGDKAVRTASLTISGGTARARFSGLTPGTYAVSVFHDANNNGKLDTFAGIPREGYGFSGNPPFKPRAPRFAEAQITLADEGGSAIRLRYIL